MSQGSNNNRGPRGGGGRGGGGHQKGRPQPDVDRIRAPYTFVPLSDLVVDEELDRKLDPRFVSQDVPFSDGIVGGLDIEIEACTPVFIRDAKTRQRFFKITDGQMAIPGSSIRGMIRNIVEIASFGRMRHFNDHRYGVRDLHNRNLYGQHMADIRDHQPTPLVSAGWLRKCNEGDPGVGEVKDDHPAQIVPCHFAKIHYNLLKTLSTEGGGFEPGEKQSAPDKYKAWGSRSRTIGVDVEWLLCEQKAPAGKPRRGDYGEVVGLNGKMRGTLVFTGQPQEWSASATQAPKRKGAGNPKQHDFVFFEMPNDKPIRVPRRVWEDFLFVHSDTGEQHRLEDKANAELKQWLKSTGWNKEGKEVPHKDHPEGIPVFFLLSPDGSLRAVGLAMMFRLAYRLSVGDAVRNSQGQDTEGFDLADVIFGHVPLALKGEHEDDRLCLKGRVMFGHAPLPKCAKELREVIAVLGSPKASYYPSYIEQDPACPGSPPPKDRKGKPVYKTFMDKDAKIRGWKRYVPKQGYQDTPKLPEKSGESVQTRFRPVMWPQGEVARCTMRVHNLRPFELGALLWALNFGGAPDTRHGLGLAKSLGYGSVRLRVGASHLRTLQGQTVDLDAARKAFVDYMEGHFQGRGHSWRASQQIVALIQAATLGRVRDDELRHMEIAHPVYSNEFQSAKKVGLALSAPFTAQDLRDAASSGQGGGNEDPVDKAERVGLERAVGRDTQWGLIRQWFEQGGRREKARQRIVRRVVGDPDDNAEGMIPGLRAWLKGT